MIVQNAAICKECNDFIVSKHRHDFVECKCGAIFVDGGQEYLRRGGKLENSLDMSWELPDDLYRACARAALDAKNTERNEYGVANAVMRKLREADRIIADGEHRVMASCQDELMVVEPDGTVNRYKKAV
jgi:hypothetical protein